MVIEKTGSQSCRV